MNLKSGKVSNANMRTSHIQYAIAEIRKVKLLHLALQYVLLYLLGYFFQVDLRNSEYCKLISLSCNLV